MLGQLCATVGKLAAAGPLGHGRRAVLQVNLTFVNLQQTRGATAVFNAENADDLWKSITVVSKNGARRGRGKKVNSRIIKDLYKDVAIGDGKVKMIWPGLNASVLRGRQIVQQEKVDTAKVDPNEAVREAKEAAFGPRKVHPLDRGFTSVNICGRNLKNTTPLKFHDDFDYRVIDNRNVCHMTGMFGRYQTAAVVVACGNGNGLIGIGGGKSLNRMQSIQKASNRALNRLLFVERYNEHTVLHDFFSQYYATKVFVSRKPEGYGLQCHRVITLLCKLVGIKDLQATVEGSTMPMNIAKAFILGLVQQKVYDEFAEEKKLHVVEFNARCRNFPTVLASPTVCRTATEIPTNENLDFKQLALGGRVKLEKPPKEPFYTRLPGWQIHLKKQEKLRGRQQNIYELMAKYGELKCFLTEKYPESHISNKIYKF